MSAFFKPLLSDCIDYYDLGRERFAALANLAAGEAERGAYLKLDLPVSVGVLDPEVARNLPLTPSAGGQHFLTRIPFEPYRTASLEAVEGTIRGLTAGIRQRPDITGTQINALSHVHRSLITRDGQVIGGDKVRIGTDIDNRIISPQLLKAPMWHFDYELDQTRPEDGFMLPKYLRPLLRGYVIRVGPPGCEENVQPEYVKDRLLAMEDGRPHPLLLKTWEISKRAIAFRTAHGIKTTQLREFIQKDPKFAARWAEFLEEQAALTAQMRKEGMVHQAAPNEILLATNYSYHVTRQPSRQLDSLFSGMQVKPEGRSL